ncbi:MAG TPA: PQQ-dependent sugar dehydrogenase [Anaerolineales bacterium]|nr:PQQ-dependent sugar dehydrogenase [Anaerolineales bacterium]
MKSFNRYLIPFSAVLAAAFALLIGFRTARAIQPPGFSYEPVASGLNLPIDAEFMPDGGILVAEKGAGAGIDGQSAIRLIRDGEVQEVPVLLLSTYTFGDSGILGLVLDPGFAGNGYFYAWYGTGRDALGWSGVTVYRLSRFTFDPLTETADPASERILIDGVPAGDYHNGGGLVFDDDGLLYIATGDANVPERSQDLTAWNGKILRILPTETGYIVPGGNPFVGDPNIPDEIFAYGLRNPFRIAVRGANGQVYAADVGEIKWEEVNLVSAGANFGWPVREGPCPIGQVTPCEPAPPGYVDPVLYYRHTSPAIGAAVSAVAFYEGTIFPEPYRGNLFFADINQGFIARSDLTGLPVIDGEFEIFDPAAGFLVDAAYRQGALYFVDIVAGKIMRLAYTGDSPQPYAVLAADPRLGPAPLVVSFSAAGSTIVPGTTPTYHWDFGDGSAPGLTSTPSTAHTYPADGNYLATLMITDNTGGGSNTAEVGITVYSGELPAIELTNLTDPERTLYHGGDEIEYRAVRSTTADLDPDTPFTWKIDLMHNQHFHPIISGHSVVSGTLQIDSSDHGGSVNLWYRFTLTMLTDTGIAVEIFEEIFPKIVTHTVTTTPLEPGVTRVSIGNVPHYVPHDFLTIAGTEIHIAAPAVILFEDGVYDFGSWSPQPGSEPFILFVSPEVETVLNASYDFIGPVLKVWMPVLLADG